MSESIRSLKKEQENGQQHPKDEEAPTTLQPTSMMLDFQPVNEALISKATSSVDRKMFRCNICDELFETEDARAKHSLVHVNRSSSLDCPICGKQFRHRTNLSTHMIVHSGVKPHQCHICLRRFTQKVNLQRHMHIHDGSRPFTCRMCQKSFTQKANLQRHILSHTECSKEDVLQALNEIPNESEINSAINENLSEALSIVMATTDRKPTAGSMPSMTPSMSMPLTPIPSVTSLEGEKLYSEKNSLFTNDINNKVMFQCFVCGKSYKQRASLQKHYAVHAADGISSETFACQTCHCSFVSKTNLQRHMLSHVTAPNQCYLCDQSFTTSDNLERHLSDHIEEPTSGIDIPHKFFERSNPGQTYRCTTCDITFVSPMIFSQHLQCHQRSLEGSNNNNNNNLLNIGDPNKAYEESQTCPLQCNSCNLVFMSVAKLETHMATHNTGTNDDEYSEMRTTEATVKPSNPIFMATSNDSTILGETSETRSVLSTSDIGKSIKSEPSSPPSSSQSSFRHSRCPVCKEMFSSKEERQKHYSLVHLKNGVDVDEEEEDEEREDEEMMDEDEDNVFEDDVDIETPYVQPLLDDPQEGEDPETQVSAITENEERMILENEEFIKDNILGGASEYESKGRYERGNYSCKICNRVLTYKYSLEKHMLLHTGSFPHKCQLCSKRFNHKANLDKHLVVHSGEKPYVCQLCSRPFSQKSNLQRHQLTHTQNRDFVCDVCGKRFNHMASLKTHSLIHTGAKPFACYVCHKRFNQKGNLKRHVQTHRTGKRGKIRNSSFSSGEGGIKMEHGVMGRMDSLGGVHHHSDEEYYDNEPIGIGAMKSFSASSSPFNTSNSRQSERVRVKNQQMDDYDFYSEDDEPLPTMIGGSEPASPNTTTRTDNNNDSSRSPLTSMANMTYSHEEGVRPKDEIVTVMPSDALENDELQPESPTMSSPEKGLKEEPQSPNKTPKKETFHCDTCSKLFVSMASLETHRKTTHSLIVCETCGKHFSQKANLLKHKLIHQNKKPFVCKVCNKAFRQKANLQRHELIHSKDRKTVSCSECNKTFRCSWSLKQHMKNHTVNCTECHKTFTSISNLQEHMKNHAMLPSGAQFSLGNPITTTTALGPDNFLYGCSVCGKTFKDKDQLQIHFSVHQAPSAFGCGICNQIYPTKDELIEHMMTHDATHVIPQDSGLVSVAIKMN